MGQGESKKGMHHRGADSAAVEIGTAMTYFPEGNGLDKEPWSFEGTGAARIGRYLKESGLQRGRIVGREHRVRRSQKLICKVCQEKTPIHQHQ